MKLYAFIVILALSLASCQMGPKQITKEEFMSIRNSIFEVTIPFRIEYKNIQFDKAIPYDKLPVGLRENRLNSVGTAFAIDDRHVASAAHVFGLNGYSDAVKEFRLKGTDGKLYQIDQVVKYSLLEDYIVFTLKDHPGALRPLPIAKGSSIGDVAYSVGNALGQGIVMRPGQITSYTPEEVNGKWNFVRFTSAASPGNSGGPLLNTSGEVTALVVRKSADENLNYAVPIEVIMKGSRESASLYSRGFKEVESGEELSTPWEDSIKLPMDFNKFAKKVWVSFQRSFVKRRKMFEKKYADKLFPKDKKLEPFMREQPAEEVFTTMRKGTDDLWSAYYNDKLKSLVVAEDQKLIVGLWDGDPDNLTAEYYLDKPKGAKLEEFLKNPKQQLDSVLANLNYHIKFAGDNIMVKSLGEPFKKASWKDAYGRKWHTSFFNFQTRSRVFITHCTAILKGVACKMRVKPYWYHRLDLYYEKIESAKTMLSYGGELRDWKEFLALPSTYRPDFFAKTKIDWPQKGFRYEIGPYKGAMSQVGVNQDSYLAIYISHHISKPDKAEITGYTLKPNKDVKTLIGYSRFYQPGKLNTEAYKTRWRKFKGRKAPFNGQLVETDGAKTMNFVKSANDKRALASAKVPPSYEIGSCLVDKTVPKKKALKYCLRFKQMGVQLVSN